MRIFTIRFQDWQDDKGNKIPIWREDLELVANISDWVQQNPGADEEIFARFCLNDSRNNLKPLTARHLSALLENVGHQKSKEIYNNLKSQHKNNIQMPLDDSIDQIFQYALLEAVNPINFFRNFKEEEFSLIRYANSTMKERIKDNLFRQRYPSIRHTSYGLLRKLGEGERKRKKVLEFQGYQSSTISNLLLAWECFYQICTPNRRGRIEPTMEHWQAIASQYNHLRQEDNRIVDWHTIKDWIDDYCVRAARTYLAPQFIYIDAINRETEQPKIDLPDLSPSPNDFLEEEEMREIVRRLETEFDFANFIQNLSNEDRKLVLLRYGFELKQTDVAEEFNWYTGNRPDNSRVSKAEDRIFRELVKAILKWMVTSKILLEESVVINSHWLKKMEIKSACEMLMKKYYSAPVKFIMDEATSALTQQLSELEGNDRLAQKYEILKNYIVNKVQTYLKITLQLNGHAATKISSLLEDFLKTAQY